MHSFSVLLALAVLNVAHSAPAPQVDRKSFTRPTSQPRAGLQMPTAAARQIKREPVHVCVNANLGTATRFPLDGKCDGKWEDLQPKDPLLTLDSTSLIGKPLGTSVGASIDKKHPGLGISGHATVLGLPLGSEDHNNHGHNGSDDPDGDDHSDQQGSDGDDDGGLFGGNGGTKLLGLGGPGSSSRSDTTSGITAGLTATLFGGGSPPSRSSSSSQSSGDGNGDGDGSFSGGPVFAGHFPPSSPDHLHDDPSHSGFTPSSSQPGSSYPGSQPSPSRPKPSHPDPSHPGSDSHPDTDSYPGSDSKPEDCDGDDGDESYNPNSGPVLAGHFGPGPAEQRTTQSPKPTSSPKPLPSPPAPKPSPPAVMVSPPVVKPSPPAPKPSPPAPSPPTLPPHHPAPPHSHQPPTWTEPEPDCGCQAH